jgi:hypothetical protein
MKKLTLPVAAGFIFLITSCSTSQINSRWASKDLEPKKYEKILVLGIMNSNDKTLKEKIEKHIAGDLKFVGYSAVTSSEEYGPQNFEPTDERKIMEKLQASGVDAVMTIVLLDKKKEKYYVPAKVQYTPYSIHNNQFPAYYKTLQNRIESEGYYVEQTRYFWECNFYKVSNKELLYSTQTTSFEGNSFESLAHQYGHVIILDMVKHRVLIKPNESALFEKPL